MWTINIFLAVGLILLNLISFVIFLACLRVYKNTRDNNAIPQYLPENLPETNENIVNVLVDFVGLKKEVAESLIHLLRIHGFEIRYTEVGRA